MKVIIAGSRNFDNYPLLKSKCDYLLKNKTDIEIVSGDAPGADTLAKQYAAEKGYKLTLFPADWSKGKKAEPIRNTEMANYATHLIAFWDSKSKGTFDMICKARDKGLSGRVVIGESIYMLDLKGT